MKRGSTIINCASVNPYIGRGDLLDYTSTKGAIVAFTRALSNQQLKNGIRVNCICPGPSTSCTSQIYFLFQVWPVTNRNQSGPRSFHRQWTLRPWSNSTQYRLDGPDSQVKWQRASYFLPARIVVILRASVFIQMAESWLMAKAGCLSHSAGRKPSLKLSHLLFPMNMVAMTVARVVDTEITRLRSRMKLN